MQAKRWIKYKKDLPKNWCQLVSENLAELGINLTPTQVKKVRSGEIKNRDWGVLVWTAINDLKLKVVKKTNLIKQLQNS